MSHHGVPQNVDIEEFEDTEEELERKVSRSANIVRASQHMIAFTGAGISTSAGIPDFRGPQGVWTLRDRGIQVARLPTTLANLSPTLTHMALLGLYESRRLKFVISQNTDGLHVRSGLPVHALAELHGNNNIEQCSKCGRRFWRPYRTRSSSFVHEHITGRQCDACGSPLQDTIVNFSESLPSDQLSAAVAHARSADSCFVLGSSCRVTPAADLPETVVLHGGRLVIVNSQRTPLDALADVRVFCRTDKFMAMLMDDLGLPIPPVHDKLKERGDNKGHLWPPG